MKRIAFLLAMGLFSLTSCDGDVEEKHLDSEIVGTWTMTEDRGSWSPVVYYKPGEVLWQFKSNGALVVENSETVKNVSDFPSGQYAYSIYESEITISDRGLHRLLVNQNILIIGDSGSDAGEWTFKRLD